MKMWSKFPELLNQPKKLAVIKVAAHKNDGTPQARGNAEAGRAAKQAAGLESLGCTFVLTMDECEEAIRPISLREWTVGQVKTDTKEQWMSNGAMLMTL